MSGGPTSGVAWLWVTLHRTCFGSIPVAFCRSRVTLS